MNFNNNRPFLNGLSQYDQEDYINPNPEPKFDVKVHLEHEGEKYLQPDDEYLLDRLVAYEDIDDPRVLNAAPEKRPIPIRRLRSMRDGR